MKKNQQLSAQVAEEFLAQNYAFRKNILNGKVEFKDIQKESEYRVFTKEALNSVIHRAKVEGMECESKDIKEVIFSENTVIHNPIKEYMDALPEWDGKDRVTPLWHRLGDVSDEMCEFLRIYHRSCVAHWLQLDTLHGNECVPTLIGCQGCGKTTFAKRLLPVELRQYFLDHLNLSNKFDKEMALTNNLLVNLDELEAIRPSQQASLKQTLSKSKVNGRPIFGGSQDDKPRFASFIATTNNPHPLSDVTGSRRYLCIKIAEGCLIDNDSPIEYEQLFAQLKYEVEVEKKSYWFTNEQTKRIQELNAPFMQTSDLEQMIDSCFRKPKEGEEAEVMSTNQIINVIRKEFTNLTVSHSTIVNLGLRLKEMGYDVHRTFKGRVYSIVQKKKAA